jgi:hypothetical protein
LSGVKQPGREADHSAPSSVDVKNAWNCTSTVPHPFVAYTGKTSCFLFSFFLFHLHATNPNYNIRKVLLYIKDTEYPTDLQSCYKRATHVWTDSVPLCVHCTSFLQSKYHHYRRNSSDTEQTLDKHWAGSSDCNIKRNR